MFDDLQEQIKRDDEATTTKSERRIRNVIVTVLSVMLFGGLYLAIRFLE